MNSTDTYFALKELGIELRLNPAQTRLGVGKHQAHLVSHELRAAVRENHDELIRGELFRRAVVELCSSMRGRSSGPGDPAYEAGRDAFGGDGRDERLNAAWHDEDLDGFSRPEGVLGGRLSGLRGGEDARQRSRHTPGGTDRWRRRLAATPGYLRRAQDLTVYV